MTAISGKIRLLLFAFLTITIPMEGGEDTYVTKLPENQERTDFRKQIEALFQKKQFEELDRQADELWKSKARWKDGLWKLEDFYRGLSTPPKKGDKKGWVKHMDAREEWVKTVPTSLVARVVLAEANTKYAWDARGSGYANTVTEEGWRLFRERLARARQILEEAEMLPGKDPELYHGLLIVARGQGWSLEEYGKVFRKGVALEPSYYNLYFEKMTYLLPRWHGDEDDWLAFAEESADATKTVMGDELYARILWVQKSYQPGDDFFKKNDISWGRMKQGFLDMEKRYPDSLHNLSAFCRFACLAGDQKTAAELFQKLGNNCDSTVWSDEILGFKKWKSWANPSETVADPQLKRKYDINNTITCLSFSPDGSKIAAGCLSGKVFLVDFANDKILAGLKGHNTAVLSVAFSPDSKIFATASSTDDKSKARTKTGEVRIWDVSSGAEMAMYEPNVGRVWGVAFSPDGKTLYSAGDGPTKPPGIALWDKNLQKIRKNFECDESKFILSSLVCSPDGKVLAYGTKRILGFRNAETGASISHFNAQDGESEWVRSVAFSPDGKTLVSTSQLEGEKMGHPGDVKLWDVATGKLKEPKIAGHRDPCLQAVFSPDGKFLVTVSADKTLCIWDPLTGRQLGGYTKNEYAVRGVSFSPDGKLIAIGGGDRVIKILELNQLLQ